MCLRLGFCRPTTLTLLLLHATGASTYGSTKYYRVVPVVVLLKSTDYGRRASTIRAQCYVVHVLNDVPLQS